MQMVKNLISLNDKETSLTNSTQNSLLTNELINNESKLQKSNETYHINETVDIITNLSAEKPEHTINHQKYKHA